MQNARLDHSLLGSRSESYGTSRGFRASGRSFRPGHPLSGRQWRDPPAASGLLAVSFSPRPAVPASLEPRRAPIAQATAQSDATRAPAALQAKDDAIRAAAALRAKDAAIRAAAALQATADARAATALQAKDDAIRAAAALQAKDDAICAAAALQAQAAAAIAMQAKAILAAAAVAPDSEGSRGRAPEAQGRRRRATRGLGAQRPLHLLSPVLEADESQVDAPPPAVPAAAAKQVRTMLLLPTRCTQATAASAALAPLPQCTQATAASATPAPDPQGTQATAASFALRGLQQEARRVRAPTGLWLRPRRPRGRPVAGGRSFAGSGPSGGPVAPGRRRPLAGRAEPRLTVPAAAAAAAAAAAGGGGRSWTRAGVCRRRTACPSLALFFRLASAFHCSTFDLEPGSKGFIGLLMFKGLQNVGAATHSGPGSIHSRWMARVLFQN